MTEAYAGEAERVQALLLAWFSPALPIGAFSYSHGLEMMCETGAISDRATAFEAIDAALRHGAGWTDGVFIAQAHAAALAGDGAAVDSLLALAKALAPSRERWEEAVQQGTAFIAVTEAVWPGQTLLTEDTPIPLAIAVGVVGAAYTVPVMPLVQAHLSGFAANLVSAAVRLVPLGQTDGQRLTRDLGPVCAEVARTSAAAPLGDVGGFTPGLDIASMHHEDQHVRLFRS